MVRQGFKASFSHRGGQAAVDAVDYGMQGRSKRGIRFGDDRREPQRKSIEGQAGLSCSSETDDYGSCPTVQNTIRLFRRTS